VMRLSSRNERSAPDQTAKQHKYDVATNLSDSGKKLLVDDVEKCPICDKEIHFTMQMTRGNYTYKVNKNGKTRYCCGYNHYLEAKKKK